MDNPFVTKGYSGAEYFCDRVSETQQLVELKSKVYNQQGFYQEIPSTDCQRCHGCNTQSA